MKSKTIPNTGMNFLVSTSDDILPASINATRKLWGVEVKLIRNKGVYELHSKRVGNKCPARCCVQLRNVQAVLTNPHELATVFDILVNQILAYSGTATVDDRIPIPGQ